MATDASAKPPAPRLNVPPAMAGALRLDPVASPSRLLEIPKTPSPSKTTYSDRFIPCRSSSRLHNFALLDRPSPSKDADAPDTPYSRLLRAELFGPDSPAPAAAGAPSSPNTNLFRFKTDHSAPFATAATAGQQDCTVGSGEASTPHKPPRKVPKTPHKVLDAPSLQDDFYLNLVDWSSQNMLTVGLGTCVYLWSASNSKAERNI